MYVLGGNMSGTRVCIGWYRAGLVYVLGGNMSGTRVCIEWDSVCIGWYHERDLCMYWVVT